MVSAAMIMNFSASMAGPPCETHTIHTLNSTHLQHSTSLDINLGGFYITKGINMSMHEQKHFHNDANIVIITTKSETHTTSV